MEEEVESVKIQTENPMLHGCITMNLDFCHTENHWISPELFIPHDKHDNFRYRYVVKYKEGVAKWLWKKVTFRGNDDKTLKEAKTRKLNNGRDQYDIFRNPHNKTLMNTIFRGQLFYVKWLYQKLSRGGDLKEVLMECEHVGFGHPSYSEKDIRIFFHWVVESTGGNMSDYHCVYLCSLLGQFVSRVRTISAEYCCRMLEDKVIDRLLSRLELCSFEALPKSTSDFIKIVAEHLFKRGSSKGYLIFIKIFCNLLNLEFVMQVADTLSPKSYTDNQFDRQVPGVLESLNRIRDIDSRKRFFSYVIKHAPSIECLWNLFNLMLQRCPELLCFLEEEFTSFYLNFILPQRARKLDFLQPCFWSVAPEKLKDKLASPFCEVLVEQITSGTTSTQERLDNLRNIALDPRLQSADTFCRLIMNISCKSEEMVSMILILLKSRAFLNCWHERFSHEEKLKVSWNWIRSQSIGKTPSERIIAAVEGSATIRATDAIKTNEKLCRALEEQVDQMVLKENFQSIMDAVAGAQIRSTTILPRLVALLKMAIKKRSGAGDHRSKYRQMIRLLGYNLSGEREKILQKVTLDR